MLTAAFLPTTNAVETIVAQNHVIITRDDLRATGDQAVYTATNGIAELTGDPMVKRTNGTLKADIILLDRGKGTVRGIKNVKVTALLPPRATNSAAITRKHD
jgi:lipopolysaccharide export system protein LptA